MKAMILTKQKERLQLVDIPKLEPQPNQVLIEVHACGVCRTDLHIVDGELPDPNLPLVLGHQIVGKVVARGKAVTHFQIGNRVGVPWLGGSCQACDYCLSGRENLCDNALYTGYQTNGGFAEYCVADARFCFSIPNQYSDIEAAPLLCGGLIGYRSYRMAGNAKRIGFYGFGSSAHQIIQLAVFEKREVFVFTRKGDTQAQEFAMSLGATWSGDSEQLPPSSLQAAIIFAPVGQLVPVALQAVDKGGTVVCAGIHMSDIPSFPYSILWGERILRSVANLTRNDGEEFLSIAAKIPIKTQTTTYPLEKVNDALTDLRNGKLKGTAVIIINKNST